MTVENLGQFYGVALSLILAYLPGVAAWYNALTSVQKAQVMLGAIFAGEGLVFAAACFGYPLFGVACSIVGAGSLLKLLVQIAIANQAAYFLLVRPYKK